MPRPRALISWLTRIALAAGSIAITAASVVYFDPDTLPPFVIEKLPLPREEWWLLALKIHVVAAAFALPACLLLSTPVLHRGVPRVHRWLGRLTGMVVLLGLVPSGLYLSLFAKGGLPGTAGFVLSGGIVAVAMVRAVAAARAGRYVAHRRWAFHVLAQLSVAVTSRAMLFALDALNVDPDRAYLASLWLPVVGSALLVERLTAPTHAFAFPERSHETNPEAVPRPRHTDPQRRGERRAARV